MSDTTPDLVYVDPGVQVVADADYPVFYSDNVYWRYDGGSTAPRADRHGGLRVGDGDAAPVHAIDPVRDVGGHALDE